MHAIVDGLFRWSVCPLSTSTGISSLSASSSHQSALKCLQPLHVERIAHNIIGGILLSALCFLIYMYLCCAWCMCCNLNSDQLSELVLYPVSLPHSRACTISEEEHEHWIASV